MLNLELVGFGLGFCGLAAGGLQSQGNFGMVGFGAGQGRAGLFDDQALGTQFFFQVFNFLGPGQQTRLLRIGGIKRHPLRADGVATGHIDGLAGLELLTLGQGGVQIGGGKTPTQPIAEQRPQGRGVKA
jgi:hypothetical protein